jgi:NADPH:quinone reductase-like Zn-dependent oxidoreductase
MAAEMQCVIAPEYTDPTNFKLSRLPIPQIQDSTEVQFRVDAASINPIDIKKASGQLKRALQDE